MPSLRSQIQDLAASFADGVLAAIKTATIDEIRADEIRAEEGPRKDKGSRLPPRPNLPPKLPPPPPPPKKGKNGRLARRSAADIEKTLGLVVAAIKGTKGKGMRAEEIRKSLGLDVREVPRVLKLGVSSKKLKSKGQKRATTYFAA